MAAIKNNLQCLKYCFCLFVNEQAYFILFSKAISSKYSQLIICIGQSVELVGRGSVINGPYPV